jgi:hypothetical protein
MDCTQPHSFQILSPSLLPEEDLYSPDIVKSARLSKFSINKGKTPVALAAGYTEKYNEETGRKKVIVVVTEDFTVSCFDASLNLLWEKSVAHKSHHLEYVIAHYAIEEAAVFITPINLSDDPTGPGVVIVGASLKEKVLEDEPQVTVEKNFNGEDGDVEHPENVVRAMLEHFSIYALDASNGHIVWMHDGSDVRQEQYTRSLPHQAYTLDSFDLSRMASHTSSGMNDWSIFKSSLVMELPHHWRGREDTSLRFAHFVRRHLGAGAGSATGKSPPSKGRKLDGAGAPASSKDKKKKGSPKGSSLSGEGLFTGLGAEPLSRSATLPHDAVEHTDHPNVLVAHTKHGIEVIALRSGVPLTSLALNRGQSYGDVDGDGVVDTILILENEKDAAGHASQFINDGEDHLQHCHMMVVSGLPPRSQLFNGTLCLHRRSMADPITKSTHRKPPVITATPPLLLRTWDERAKNTESKKKNVVVATNMGLVTSYRSNGEFDWQCKHSPGWKLEYAFASLLHFDVDSERAEEVGSHDTVYSQLLVLGESEVSLVSRDGYVLTAAKIPNTPIARPVIGDFNSDGYTDLIIATDDALLGYRLEVIPSTKGLLIAFLVLSALMALFFWLHLKAEVQDTRGGKRKVYSLIRSTDESHID